MKYRLASAAFLGAAVLAACAAHSGSGNLPPQPGTGGTESVSTSNGVTTVSGPIVAVKSSNEFEVNAGSGCGYLNIFTTSSTTFSPSGSKPAAGDNSVSSGTGSCATSLTASSVSLSGAATIKGTIVAVKSSTEFEVNGGSGCGYVNIFTTSSTTFSPSGATPAVGSYSESTGTGSCASSLTASSVTLSTPSPSPSPSASATPTPMPASATIGYGEIFGADDTFAPVDGDTSSGGQGQTVDGMPCVSSMPNTYHVHAFVGIIINGRQLAIPDGIGMDGPGADGTYAGIPNWTEYATCYYYIHTHDASGVLHVESPQSASLSSSLYTLGNAFDMWGMALSSTQIGPYSGTVRAYVAQVPLKTAQILRSDYTLYGGDPRTVPLYSHTTAWLEIGPAYIAPSSLPVLNYYEEY